ncbi:MAG: hypothetical protein GVY28_08470 [Alphaproteobacteria bacterium]|jgi:DNA polymerase-3 subunit delta'|nr:hypothetical protein [Alphaproteobacteria bacterium]
MQHILGQDAAIGLLQQALGSGRVHHAWIFHGPAGVGKFTAARAFAKVLLCPNARPDPAGQVTACDGCEACRMIDSPNTAHPDLHVVTKELALYSDDATVRQRKLMTIPVNVLRTHLIGPAQCKSQLNHNKAFIVDESELLDLTGQNTLLKTLEEPPDGTYLVLVTAHEDRLLPTLRSRCQRVAFGRLDESIVRQWLDGRSDLDAQRRQAAARMSGGSLGLASLAADYGLDEWVGRLEPLIEALGRGQTARAGDELGPLMAELTGDFAERWVKAHANASKDAANKQAVRLMLGLLGEACRRRIRATTAEPAANDPDQAERRAEPWLVGVDLVTEAERYLASNVAPNLLLDNLALQWSRRAAAQASPATT